MQAGGRKHSEGGSGEYATSCWGAGLTNGGPTGGSGQPATRSQCHQEITGLWIMQKAVRSQQSELPVQLLS